MKPFDFLLVRIKDNYEWKQAVHAEWGRSLTIKEADGTLSCFTWSEVADLKLSPVPDLGNYHKSYNFSDIQSIGMGYAV